jgi:Tol biopolymer transport system component
MMARWPDQPWKIYWVSAEGGALHEINVPITNQADPNWMPDNQSILFGQPPLFFAEPDTPRAIYIHNLQTDSLSKVPGSDGWFSPRISPDGTRFLAQSMDQHRLGMYDFATSQWRILLEGPQWDMLIPFWSPDGKWVYLTVYGEKNSIVRIQLPAGSPEEVFSLKSIKSPICWGREFAPDGSLMISCDHPNSNIYALQYE